MNSSNQVELSDAMKNMVELYSDALYSWAYFKVSDKEAAEDLVQETFLAALESFHKFQGKSNEKTWLFAILNNKIIDHHRRSFKSSFFMEEVPGKDSFMNLFFDENDHWKTKASPCTWNTDEKELLDDSDFSQVLKGCMSKLPSQWFSSLQLKYLQEKDGPEVCQELGITPSNFWQILHRAKLQLRKCLEINWFK